MRNRKERLTKDEQSLKDLCDTIRFTYIHIMGIAEGKGREKISRNNIQKLPKFDKRINLYIPDTKQTPSRINSKRSTPNCQNPKTEF